MPTLIIIGAGPNLGAAIARRFGSEGFAVGLVARDSARLNALAQQLGAEGITGAFRTADIRDAGELHTAIRELEEELGAVEVLQYSPLPAREFMKPILETTADDVRGPLEFSVVGAVAAATAVIDGMLARGSGSVLYTTGGAAIKPYPERAGVGISFAGEVAYARMLHDAVAERGVHVGHTAIAGSIGEGKDHEPADVAETIWRHHVDHDRFQVLIGFD